MTRKKILFTCLRMNVGGVEKAMLSLFAALDRYVDPEGRTGRELFDIHLALMAAEGGFMQEIPGWITVHPIGGFAFQQELWRPPIKGILKQLATLRWLTGIPAAWHFATSQLTKSLFPYVKWLLRDDRPGRRFANADLDGEFDLAIDFPGIPGEYLGYYVAEHIKAKRRASWIHFDLDRIFIRPKSAAAVYDKMDRVYAVSEQALAQFNERFPGHASKGRLFHNLIDPAEIIRLSNEPPALTPVENRLFNDAESRSRSVPERSSSRINLVTVGRAMRQKGQDLALRTLRKLVDDGHTNLFWHFVGGGDQLEEYRALAAELGLSDYCRFYGAVTNPYPYMRMADLYLQPSRFEGYGITIAEAKCFGMPIVATDFVGAAEQLDGRSNAIVIPNFITEDDAEIATLTEAISRGLQMPRIAPATDMQFPEEIADFIALLK